MPVTTFGNVGGQQVVSGTSTLRRSVSLTADAASNTDSLQVKGMPHLCFWLRQTVGALGATILPQYSIRAINAGPPPTPEWLDLDAPLVLAFDTPVLLNYDFPATLIRLQLTRSAGQATTVQIALGCFP